MCFHPWPNFSPGKDTQKTTLTSQLPAYVEVSKYPNIDENNWISHAQNITLQFYSYTGDKYEPE